MQRLLFLLLLASAVGGVTHNAHGQITFSEPVSFPAGEEPFIPDSADLNGDGLIDLAVPNRHGDAVSILLGDGKGGFSAPSTIPTGRGPRNAIIVDLNGDGIVDVVTMNRDSGDLTLLFGDGTGGFPQSFELPVRRGPQAAAVRDLNGDGSPDLAIAAREARRILVYLNDGEGRFSEPEKLVVGKGPRSIIAEDLNGDGRPDLATADRIDGTISVRFAHVDGGFQDSLTMPAGRAPTYLVATDIDLDGNADLIASDRTTNDLGLYGGKAPGADLQGMVYIFRGDGKGDFDPPTTWKTGGHPAGIAVVDLNMDGLPDIAIANNMPDNLVVLIGDTTGGFSDPIIVSEQVGQLTRAVVAADLDADGRTDLIVSSRDSNRVFVLMNRTVR